MYILLHRSELKNLKTNRQTFSLFFCLKIHQLIFCHFMLNVDHILSNFCRFLETYLQEYFAVGVWKFDNTTWTFGNLKFESKYPKFGSGIALNLRSQPMRAQPFVPRFVSVRTTATSTSATPRLPRAKVQRMFVEM